MNLSASNISGIKMNSEQDLADNIAKTMEEISRLKTLYISTKTFI